MTIFGECEVCFSLSSYVKCAFLLSSPIPSH
jgi:hypothetical protein